jgi:hypothetical protein
VSKIISEDESLDTYKEIVLISDNQRFFLMKEEYSDFYLVIELKGLKSKSGKLEF